MAGFVAGAAVGAAVASSVSRNSLVPADPARVRGSHDGIQFSEETRARVAQRPRYQDPLEAKTCPNCSKKLALLSRRYCEMDGRLYCRGCTSRKIDLSHLGFDSESHVCDSCYEKRSAENATEMAKDEFQKAPPSE